MGTIMLANYIATFGGAIVGAVYETIVCEPGWKKIFMFFAGAAEGGFVGMAILWASLFAYIGCLHLK
jgi:hypothetical protein